MNYNRNWMVFYFIYGFLAKVLLINVIISVLVEKYIASKEKLGNKHCKPFYNYILEKENLLTDFQKEWKTIRQLISRMKPRKKVFSF